MANSYQTENFAAENESSLQALVRAIARSQGQFSLIFLRCNYAVLRECMVQRLRELASIKIRELILPESIKTLYTTIQAEIGCEQPPALMVIGLDTVSDIDTVLTSTNQVREEFSKNFPFPLLLWVNDQVLQKLIRLTPDFESWATTIEFELTSDELVQFLQQTVNDVFSKVLEVGADTFVDLNAALNLGVGSSRRFELESARKDLQRRGVNLQPELEASLEFVLGRDACNSMEQSLEHYKRSLEFWEKCNRPEWQGCLLFCLGLWWRTDAVLHRSRYEQSCTTAKDYYQQSIKVFQQANRPDLEAKFINALGEVLLRLNQWNELEDIAKRAQDLHQLYFYPIRLAYSYGLLAEVALAKSAWHQAQQYTEKAQHILENAAEPALNYCYLEQSTSLAQAWQSHGGWYLLLLAQAQQHLDRVPEAIKNLETARAESKPEYNPPVYIRILEVLRSLYFKQGQYLKAFQIKQEKRQIEHQYGFRAFIGADQLPLKQQVINSALVPSTQSANNSEIATSARRQQEVDYLIKERISRFDHKLIVIHGQSGVGKSSMVNKELLPALEYPISQYKTLPVVQKFYTNWVQELGNALSDALEKKGMSLPATLNSVADIITELRNHKNCNLQTVLIFDQFEEFFFVCTELYERRPFYEFLHTALNIPCVKIILLLREDYLHYLLEWERFTNLDIINNDILSKNIRYSLKEFSPEDAKLNIQSLTARSHCHFEPTLIDALVQDLAGDLGVVRPIELQIVGAQLEEDNITTLKQYQQLGSNSKAKLVERYLEQVIQDCGLENKRIAQLILFLLTDENGTRPLKSRAELIEKIDTAGLQLKANQLDLVLEILVSAGFVFRVREQPADRYHLVHDYLIAFIRQQQEPELLEELKLTKFQEKQERQRAEIAEIEALSSLSQALLLSHDQLEALVTAVQAGKKLQEIPALVDIKLKQKTIANLQQAVYGIQERNRLQGHSARILSVSFSPDGQMIASASDDSTIKLWQQDGTLVKTLQGHNLGVNSVSFSPDGQILASASTDKTVKLWRVNDTELLNTFTRHTDWVLSVSFSPDGQMIASASDDCTIKLWKQDGTEVRTLLGHSARVRSVSFSPDGKIIASTSDDRTVKLWNLNGTLVQTLLGHSARVRSVSFSPDGQMIASASDDRTVKLWNLNGTEVQTLQGHSDRVRNVSFSPDGQTIASASDDSKVKLWSLNGIVLKTFKGHRARSRSVSFSPDGQLLASASDDGTVKLWSLEGIEKPTHQGHSARVSCVSFSPHGQILASASEDKTVKLWNLEGKKIQTFRGHTCWVRSVSFSPNGQIVASASEDKTVRLWSVDGTLLQTFKGHSDRVRCVSFSPDGNTIASSSDDQTIKLWSLDGREIRTFHGHCNWIWGVSFSPDGKAIASASDDRTVKLWNLAGLELCTFQGHQNWVRSVSFSPDGKMIASASDDRTVKLWSLDGRELQTLQGHRDAVNSVTFSPDSQLIASASDDKTVKLWNLEGKDLQTFHGHNNCVNSVSFSPDGKLIASASDGKTVRIWKINHLDAPTELDALLVRGCQWLHAYLTTNPNISESDRHLCNDIQ